MLADGMRVRTAHQGPLCLVSDSRLPLGMMPFGIGEDLLLMKRILRVVTPRNLSGRTYRPSRELAVTRLYRALALRLGKLGM